MFIQRYEDRLLLSAVPFSAQQTIDGDFDNTQSVVAADIDGDGDVDVVGAAKSANDVAWWENADGSGTNWTKRTIDADFLSADQVTTGDVDGDGDLDVIASGYGAKQIAWWENANGQGTAWQKHVVHSGSSGPRDASAADLDGDGDLDLFGVVDTGDAVAWWENLDGTGLNWVERTVGLTINAENVFAADIDGDEDVDILVADPTGDDILWFENENPDSASWTAHTIDSTFDGAWDVFAGDVDQDGDVDVLGAAWNADDITWWENVDGTGTLWSEHTVDGEFNAARAVFAADLDSDGDLDVLGASDIDFDDGTNDVSWWENTSGDGTTWTEHVVATVFGGAFSLFAADVDGDDDMDVVGASRFQDDIAWWRNHSGPETVVDGTSVNDTIVVRYKAGDASRVEVEHVGVGTTEYDAAELGVLRINGLGGQDRLDASEYGGPVVLVGGNGNDTLLGGRAGDWLNGQRGRDSLVGGRGPDRMFGGSEADWFDGGADDDTIRGQGGRDTLRGGDGDDKLVGGSGYDRLLEWGNLNFFLADAQLTGRGNDELVGIEAAVITGGNGDNVLDAHDFTGPTTLSGGAGHDTLSGGTGADFLHGGQGADSLVGRNGNDTLHGGNSLDILNGGDGDDILYGGGGNDGLSGMAGDDWLLGEDGDDTLLGGEGNDRLYGHAGSDTLLGEAGVDYVRGGDDADTVTGAGNGTSLEGDNVAGETIDDDFVFDAPWVNV